MDIRAFGIRAAPRRAAQMAFLLGFSATERRLVRCLPFLGFALFCLAVLTNNERPRTRPSAPEGANATTAAQQPSAVLFLPLGPLLLFPIAFSDLVERLLRLSRPTPLVTTAPGPPRAVNFFSGALLVAAALANRMTTLATWLMALLLLGAGGVAPTDLFSEFQAALKQETAPLKGQFVLRASQTFVALLSAASCYLALGSLLLAPFLCAPLVKAAVESRRFGRLAEPATGEPIVCRLLADASLEPGIAPRDVCMRPKSRTYLQSNEVLND